MKKTLKNFGKVLLCSFLTFIFPLGRRTATAYFSLLRIIPHSITACPPTSISYLWGEYYLNLTKKKEKITPIQSQSCQILPHIHPILLQWCQRQHQEALHGRKPASFVNWLLPLQRQLPR